MSGIENINHYLIPSFLVVIAGHHPIKLLGEPLLSIYLTSYRLHVANN